MAITYQIGLKEIQWIDIRSPREFKTGSIPGAINLPLFLDDAYETVGTLYKKRGPQEAKRSAMKLVAERLPELYEAFLQIEALGKPMVMFCARGGMRSKTLTNLLSNLGHDLERLEGGYKAYRQVILDETERACKRVQMVVLHGMTGVGKTQILLGLDQTGTKMIDIEGISAHRGSMLGRIGLPEQPSQREFEHHLLTAVLDAGIEPVFVEAESKRLGRNTLPEPFIAAMKRGKHIDLTASIPFRKEILVNEYAHCEDYIEQMIEVMNGFVKQMGHEKVLEMQNRLRLGDLGYVAELLMIEYYDPKYNHSSIGVVYDASFEVTAVDEMVKTLNEWKSQQEWLKLLDTKIVNIESLNKFEEGTRERATLLDGLLSSAAAALKAGETVAFPTETVYGIGADALNEAAVAKIFQAKGRPADNPLIVHVAAQSEVAALVSHISPVAQQLMDAFWPGALTLIMPKSEKVSKSVTAGLETVAVRMPSHSVAKRLIELAGCPVAAPSANLSGKPSPTCGADVVSDLDGRVAVIVYGEEAVIGLESTVVDLTGDEPVVLRPGGVTLEAIQAVAGSGRYDEKLNLKLQAGEQPKSPGMKYTHYAPEAEVTVFCGEVHAVRAEIEKRVADGLVRGIKPGVMTVEEIGIEFDRAQVISLGSFSQPDIAASLLFKSLRAFDRLGVDEVYAVGFEDSGIGKAIMNRLIKAAGHRVVLL